MLKLLSVAASAVILLASCGKNELLSGAFGPQAVEFYAYQGNAPMGKGLVTDNGAAGSSVSSSIKETGFGITAYYTETSDWEADVAVPNFMYNQKVVWDSASEGWTYSPFKYWPTMPGEKISFFAYAPYADGSNGLTPSENTAKTPSVKWALTEADKLVDFVAAAAMNRLQDNTVERAEPIGFDFKHQMSRLGFRVRTSEDMASGSYVVLTSAKLLASEKLYEEAVYTFDASGNGVWGSKSERDVDYDIWTVVNASVPANNKIGGKEYTGRVLDVKSSTAKPLFRDGHYLFLIPETPHEGSGTAEGDLRMEFSYDIVSEDAGLPDGYVCSKCVKTVDLPKGLLRQGVAYLITVTIKVDRIEFTAEVVGWNTYEEDKETTVK